MELIDASELHPQRDHAAAIRVSGVLPRPAPVDEPQLEPWDGTESPRVYRHKLYRFAHEYAAWIDRQYVQNQAVNQGSLDDASQGQTGPVGPTEAGTVPG